LNYCWQKKESRQDLGELKGVAMDVAKQAVETPSSLLTNETLVKLTTVLTKTMGGGATYVPWSLTLLACHVHRCALHVGL
jgi:hypothetical protein